MSLLPLGVLGLHSPEILDQIYNFVQFLIPDMRTAVMVSIIHMIFDTS